MFGAEPAPAYRPDPDKVRRRLYNILAELRTPDAAPKPTRLSLYQTIFPQMASFLPPDEGDQLRFEFAQELQRLDAAG